MTSFLRINGIAVPVLEGNAKHEQQPIGEADRAADASLRAHHRTLKGKWGGTVAHQVAATALAFRDLVNGEGHSWGFEGGHLYTSKGLGPSSASATLSITNAKFGGYRLAYANQTAVYPVFVSGQPWTVALWHTVDNGITWTHYVVRSDGAKWVDGVRNDGASTGFIAVASGSLTLGNAALTGGIDDVVALPFLVPLDWPAQMFGYGAAFSLLRQLFIDGLFVEANLKTKTVLGTTGALTPATAWVGGVQQQVWTIEASLEEV